MSHRLPRGRHGESKGVDAMARRFFNEQLPVGSHRREGWGMTPISTEWKAITLRNVSTEGCPDTRTAPDVS